jgi:hypothetical protein
MSSSGVAPGTSTFTSEDFAVVMAACFDVSERYSCRRTQRRRQFRDPYLKQVRVEEVDDR